MIHHRIHSQVNNAYLKKIKLFMKSGENIPTDPTSIIVVLSPVVMPSSTESSDSANIITILRTVESCLATSVIDDRRGNG